MLHFAGKSSPPVKFTPDQLREIEEVRARTRAYLATIERYPYRPSLDFARDKPEPTPQVVEHIHRHSDMGPREFDLLRQTTGKVEYMEKRLNQRRQKGKY